MQEPVRLQLLHSGKLQNQQQHTRLLYPCHLIHSQAHVDSRCHCHAAAEAVTAAAPSSDASAAWQFAVLMTDWLLLLLLCLHLMLQR